MRRNSANILKVILVQLVMQIELQIDRGKMAVLIHHVAKCAGHCDLMGFTQGIDYEKKENVLGGDSAGGVDRFCILA